MDRDTGLELVRAFNEAFDCYTLDAPASFRHRMGSNGRRSLQASISVLRQMASDLKKEAAVYNRNRQTVTSLFLIRLQLSLEELAEFWEAVLEGDLAHMLRELLDRQWVLDGDFLTFGLAGCKAEGLQELARANMAKLWPDGKPRHCDAGRVLKPEGWTPPNFSDIISRAAPQQGGEG